MAGVSAKSRPVSLGGWHQRSGSWFGDGVRRAMRPMCFVCTSLCKKLFKTMPRLVRRLGGTAVEVNRKQPDVSLPDAQLLRALGRLPRRAKWRAWARPRDVCVCVSNQ